MFAYDDMIYEYKYYCKKFEDIIKEKTDKLKNTYVTAMKKVVREEFCSGSDLFLGFYCPSPVFDLIVGNTHRGKILKRITKRSVISHKYGFDIDGKILIIDDFNNNTNCIYEYENDVVIIICYTNEEIEYIVECEYDDCGRIIKYTFGSLLSNKCDEIEQEIYKYGNDGMETVTTWHCISVCDNIIKMNEKWIKSYPVNEKSKRLYEQMVSTGCLASGEVYKLLHDSQGYLTGYKCITDADCDDTVYEISKNKTRKI